METPIARIKMMIHMRFTIASVIAAIILTWMACHTMQQTQSQPTQPVRQSPTTAPASEKRVTGVGGIFFKCKDPNAMKKWYHEHLGLATDKYGTNFESRRADDPAKKAFLQWAPFKQDTKYFQPSTKEFMINYRVENLDRLVAQLKAEGVTVVDEIQTVDYGKFVHIMDPEGNKIELFEPNDAAYDKMLRGGTK